MIRCAAQNGLSRAFSPITAASSRAWSNLLGGCSRRGSMTTAAGRGGERKLIAAASQSQPPIRSLWSWSSLLETSALRGVNYVGESTFEAKAAARSRLFSSANFATCLALVVPDAEASSGAGTRTGDWGRRWLSSASTRSGGKGRVQDEAKGNSTVGGNEAAAASAASQHEEWVAFQRKISVQGFETGQQTQVASRSKRGGKLVRRKQQKLRERDMDDPSDPRRFTDLAGGEFPPFRYSEEETERLLAQAYANLPERAGKRGTRNLKRQGRRWFLVRKVRKLYKHHMANFQERKMAKRSEKVRLVKEVLQEAPTTRLTDRQYQAQVFAKWSSRMEQRRVVMDGGTRM